MVIFHSYVKLPEGPNVPVVETAMFAVDLPITWNNYRLTHRDNPIFHPSTTILSFFHPISRPHHATPPRSAQELPCGLWRGSDA